MTSYCFRNNFKYCAPVEVIGTKDVAYKCQEKNKTFRYFIYKYENIKSRKFRNVYIFYIIQLIKKRRCGL